MKGAVRLVRIMGIDIYLHITFLLLLGFFAFLFGPRGLAIILGIFFFVTVHELSHSLVAAHFGIKVKKITLLPIGGVASMTETPSKPYQEFLISLAGPLSNVIVVIVFFFPLYAFLGGETLFYPLKIMTGQAEFKGDYNIFAYVYWINLLLAAFNMIPAFPMDGGRALRAFLTRKMGLREATNVAVRLGHIFALVFGYIGIVHGHIFLVIIAVFIYMSASSEGMQVDLAETIKGYTVSDVLPEKGMSLDPATEIGKVLEIMFHSHMEDFPVVSDGRLEGVITRREVIQGMHIKGKKARVSEVMRKDLPVVDHRSGLAEARSIMMKNGSNALPVVKEGKIAGIVTMEDINRVYMMMHDN